ncbi:MAG: Uma2 family endonuclease [Paracoccaceae bacterium]
MDRAPIETPADRPLTIRPNASYKDVLAAPPGMNAELLGGTLYLQPRPRPRHARVEGRLANRLIDPYEDGIGGPGGWWLLIEPDVFLGEDVVIPDLAGWRRERMPDFPEAAIDLAPDWVCEILSPSTRRFDLTLKRERYRRAGVAHLWLIDPDARTLEAFALDGGAWRLDGALGDEADVSLAPFEAVSFPLATLFPPPLPSSG